MTAVYIAYVFAIVVLSILPGSDGPPPFPHIDKVEHFIAYSGLAILSMIVFRKTPTRAVGLTAGILLGIALEFIQGQIPGRFPSAFDALANSIGISAGALMYQLNQMRIQKIVHLISKFPP